jgi:hypothetical protein
MSLYDSAKRSKSARSGSIIPLRDGEFLRKFGYSTSEGIRKRRAALIKAISYGVDHLGFTERESANKVRLRLQAVSNISHRTNPPVSKIMKMDADWVNDKFIPPKEDLSVALYNIINKLGHDSYSPRSPTRYNLADSLFSTGLIVRSKSNRSKKTYPRTPHHSPKRRAKSPSKSKPNSKSKSRSAAKNHVVSKPPRSVSPKRMNAKSPTKSAHQIKAMQANSPSRKGRTLLKSITTKLDKVDLYSNLCRMQVEELAQKRLQSRQSTTKR